MVKYRLYFDLDKEEKFLNEYSKKGYALVSYVGGFYKFKKINETDYTYRVDIVNDKTTTEFNEYIDLLRESGAELVQTIGPWAYFRKKGKFELYTDSDSKIAFYEKMRRFFLLISLSEFCISLGQWTIKSTSHFNIYVAIFIDLMAFGFLIQGIKLGNKIKQIQNKKI